MKRREIGGAKEIIMIIYVLLVFALVVGITTALAQFNLIFAFFGWRALNKIQPAMFVWMPLIGWVIYFYVKFILSAIVGVFVTPVVIFKFLLYLTKQMVG